MVNDIRLNLRCSRAFYKLISRHAQLESLSVAELIRRSVVEHIAKNGGNECEEVQCELSDQSESLVE